MPQWPSLACICVHAFVGANHQPNQFMTLSNQTTNEDKSEKSDFDINFTIEPSIAKNV